MADIYYAKQVKYLFDGKEIFVISDLHLGSGLNSNRNYSGIENFFADQSFKRFVDHLLITQHSAPSLLVINGDLVDFLRIIEIPGNSKDLMDWQAELIKVGIFKETAELEASIADKERQFGLKTNDYKSIWKLFCCVRGHKPVFDALAKWLSKGNKLIIVKGNHDLEWYWEAVRKYLSVLLAQISAEHSGRSESAMMDEFIIPNLTFVDDSMLINDNIYIEHGHHYENFTTVYGPTLVNNDQELGLPMGSFFNRYFLNRIELAYPYYEDVRPRENILSFLLRERFPLAIKMLFYYVPLSLRLIPKKQYKYALRFLFQFLLIIAVPLAVTIIAFIHFALPLHLSSPTGIWKSIISSAESMAFMSLSYFLGKLMSYLQLSSPATFSPNALDIFNQPGNAKLELVTFGHTHDPEQLAVKPGKRYYNTGSWIPVFETDSADIRIDKTYTSLHIRLAREDGVLPTALMRWNDDALRIDELTLMERK